MGIEQAAERCAIDEAASGDDVAEGTSRGQRFFDELGVALRARKLAIQFVRDALADDQPPFSAIRALGEIESLESLALVRQAMAHPELIRTAQAILEKRFLKSKDEQVAAGARQVMADHFSTEKPSSSRFIEEFETQTQPRQSAADVPKDIATWEIVEAVRRAKFIPSPPGAWVRADGHAISGRARDYSPQ